MADLTSCCRSFLSKIKPIIKLSFYNTSTKFRRYATKAERKTRRQELITEFKKGSYFADIREYQRTGGKRFIAPNELMSGEDARKFPCFTATSLLGRSIDLEKEFTGHVTLLLIALRGIAQPMCDLYRNPFQEAYGKATGAKCFEVNVVEYWIYGLFRGFISRGLKKTIPTERHENFLCYYGSMQPLKKQDLLGNAVVGHAFLIDRKGFVRWKACAAPTEDEIESMIRCTKQLLP